MAFYDDMADVATELLTEFGKPVTFERVTKTFNKITGKDTARTVAQFSTVGVELSINQRLIDGTRIQSGDRFVIVDSSYAPTMSDRLQDAASVSCAYPLDGSEAEVLARMAAATGITGKATTSEQVVSHVFNGSTCNLGAINSLETTFDPTVGGKAFEVELTIPTLETTSEAEIYLYVYPKSSDVDSFIRDPIASKVSGGDFEFEMDFVAHALTTGDRVGVYLDPTPVTGGWRYYLNGVDVGGVSGGPVAYTDLCIGFRIEVTATSAPDISDTLAAELISSASDMTGTYPAGTTDICGNPVGYPDISDSWAIIDIQPINPAGTPIAYRVQVRK